MGVGAYRKRRGEERNGGQASSLQIIIRRLEACPPFNKLQFI